MQASQSARKQLLELTNPERARRAVVSDLLDRRVVIVLGKGGVGKSVVAGALGLKAAERGRETVVAETGGAETMSALFDRDPVGYKVTELTKHLHALSITSEQATEEYLVRTLRFRLLYEVVFRNRFIEPFMNGVLGLSDLISIGKIMDLEWERSDGNTGPTGKGPHRWDFIVLDAPATGHGLSLLSAPQTIMDLTRAGPLFNNSSMIRDLLADRSRTAAVLVTLPEEMPINETLQLARSLENNVDIEVAGVVVNAMPPKLFADREQREAWSEIKAYGMEAGGEARSAVLHAERTQRERARADAYVSQLRAELDLPIAELPLLARRDLDVDALRLLGDAIRWTS